MARNRNTWRDQARPAVARAIADGKDAGLTGRDLLRHIQAFYPFGSRGNWPYKVWLDEVRCQLGSRPRKRTQASENPDQKALF